jgi:hypothetical protein
VRVVLDENSRFSAGYLSTLDIMASANTCELTCCVDLLRRLAYFLLPMQLYQTPKYCVIALCNGQAM